MKYTSAHDESRAFSIKQKKGGANNALNNPRINMVARRLAGDDKGWRRSKMKTDYAAL